MYLKLRTSFLIVMWRDSLSFCLKKKSFRHLCCSFLHDIRLRLKLKSFSLRLSLISSELCSRTSLYCCCCCLEVERLISTSNRHIPIAQLAELLKMYPFRYFRKSRSLSLPLIKSRFSVLHEEVQYFRCMQIKGTYLVQRSSRAGKFC